MDQITLNILVLQSMAYVLILPFRFPFFVPLIPCANKEKNVINEVTSSSA